MISDRQVRLWESYNGLSLSLGCNKRLSFSVQVIHPSFPGIFVSLLNVSSISDESGLNVTVDCIFTRDTFSWLISLSSIPSPIKFQVPVDRSL